MVFLLIAYLLGGVQEHTYGLSCLHCMNSKADNAYQIFNLLQDSKHPAITNILIDGSFGYDSARFRDLIGMLDKNDTVILYMQNGPWQRKCRYYKWTCVSNTRQGKYIRQYEDLLISRMDDVMWASRKVRVFISPALEDNYDDETFKVLAEKTEYLYFFAAGFVRNPCKGGKWIPPGWLKESHNIHNKNPYGIISNDGEVIGINKANRVKNRSSYFIYWDAKRQGKKGTELFSTYPDNRKYATIKSGEYERLLQYLGGRL